MLVLTIAGNLGDDAEIKDVGRDQVCSFSVAHNEDKDEDPVWVRVSVWGKYGESLHKYLRKGDPVVVVGELSVKEGKERTFLDLRASKVQMMGTKPKEDRSSHRSDGRKLSRREEPRREERRSRHEDPPSSRGGNEDDISF